MRPSFGPRFIVHLRREPLLFRKLIASGLLLGLLIWPVSIEAKPWYKDVKVWVILGIGIGASAAATHWSHECRVKFGPAPCDGGYGEYRAREGARMVGTLGMDALALWGRHEGFKEWPIMALGYPAYNTYVAAHQSRIGCPTGEHFLYGTKDTCVDNYSWGAGH